MNVAKHTVIDKADLKKKYQMMKLPANVINRLIQAHEDIFEKGMKTNWEWVVSIDCKTGNIADKLQTNNLPDKVYWPKNTNIAGVHNHPNSKPFSVEDVLAFIDNFEAISLSIQGHNGDFYILARTKTDINPLTENCIRDKLDTVILDEDGYYKKLTLQQRHETVLKHIASEMSWLYLRSEIKKGGGLNEE